MAKKKHKKRPYKKSRKTKAHARSGKSTRRKKNRGGGRKLETVGQMAAVSFGMRIVQGLAFYGFRKYVGAGKTADEQANRQKLLPMVKIGVPAAVVALDVAGMIPRVEGLLPIAVDQTVQATVENVPMLKDIADLKFLSGTTRSGTNARSFLETARQINNSPALSTAGRRLQMVGKYEKSGYTKEGGRFRTPAQAVLGARKSNYTK